MRFASGTGVVLGLALGLILTSAVQAQSDEYEAATKQAEEIGAVLEREEFLWLNGLKTGLKAEKHISGGAIYWVGFFPERDLVPEYLPRFVDEPIKPNIILVDRQHDVPMPVELAWAESPVPGKRCVAIIQIVRDDRKPVDEAAEQRALRSYRLMSPDYPLDEECNEAIISAEEYQAKNSEKTTSGIMHFSTNRRCDDFESLKVGEIQISETTKISTHAFANIGRGPNFSNSNAEMPMRFLSLTIQKWFDNRRLPKAQFMRDQLPNTAAENIELETYFLLDHKKRAFCSVLVARQGEALWQEVVYSPQAGRNPIWAREHDEAEPWDPRDVAAWLGYRLASDVVPADEEVAAEG